MGDFLSELWAFMKERKKFWLLPIIVMLVLLGSLIVLTQGSAVAPFIYMTAEFYLQTVREVFQKHSLPKGEFMHRGNRIDPAALKDTALLAVEGERDDISGLGQTKAALTISTSLPDDMKRHYVATGVGHYGIFNGNKWRTKIAPVMEKWIVDHDG